MLVLCLASLVEVFVLLDAKVGFLAFPVGSEPKITRGFVVPVKICSEQKFVNWYVDHIQRAKQHINLALIKRTEEKVSCNLSLLIGIERL